MEDKVKAAYLLNFSRYTQWPEEAFVNPTDPLVVCVLGQDPMGGILDRTLAGRTSQGRRLRALRVSAPDQASGCHVLYIPASETAQASEVLASLDGDPVLTVGDAEDFLSMGGILRFRVVDARLRFDANQAAARRVGLKLSSALLDLAHQVVNAAGSEP